MKLFQSSILATVVMLIIATGCSKKFEENSLNKNLPQSVPPGVILRSVLHDMVVAPGDWEDKAGQFICSNYTYYGDNKYWSGSASLNYGTLNNVVAMEAQAKKATGTDNNPYHALGLFFRAFFFVNMTEKVGDLPMTDALKGVGNTSPKYDSQKQIFKQSLLWLDSANLLLNNLLANGFLEFSGDFYYKEAANGLYAGNNGRDALVEWQKVVNSYKLRVLIELSKKAADADLNIAAQFSAIVGNPKNYPLFTSNADNLQYVYNAQYNYYPDNPSNYGNNAGRLNIAATWLNTLSSLHDLRAMVVAEPARGLGYADTDFNSFAGAPSGQDLSSMAALSAAGKLSLYNYNHFYTTFTAEPTFIISYPEVCFCIAEAINRGWVSGNAESWYQNGVKAMFEFYGIKDGSNQVVFRNNDGSGNVVYNITFQYNDYFNQPLVKYKGNNTDGLSQILTQKYLAYARNSGLQAYYQWRRTGIPVFSAGPGTGNGGIIPKRFQYPSNERSVNADNYKTAVQSQYGGSDDINAAMWIIK
ncbi:MAG: SusD/RagB family nutrient-binding outer membrane lipoprotein [Sphingobacteriales bacterium]|nr:SusD/RagB family nutrient-binding outer membrane lipoprotein [Sphingobacteriales bacterium]